MGLYLCTLFAEGVAGVEDVEGVGGGKAVAGEGGRAGGGSDGKE